MAKYINRYKDEFTFTLNDDKSINWTGPMEFLRMGYPNVYKAAYQQYRKDGGELHIETFKKEVHLTTYPEEGGYIKSEINEKYGELVYSDQTRINMIDPSGGPYLHEHMNMGQIAPEFEGLMISGFHKSDNGYTITTYGQFDHLQDTEIIGGIILK